MVVTINKDLTGKELLTIGINKTVFKSSLCFNFTDSDVALYVIRVGDDSEFNKTNVSLYEYLITLTIDSIDSDICELKERLNSYAMYLEKLDVNKEEQYRYIIGEVEKVIQELL